MSAGLFQALPGAHEMGSTSALSSEPWLLPISDGAPAKPDTSDALAETVRKASRRLWIAANTLCAALALLLTAQVATDWQNAVKNPGTGQIADASPPILAADKANLTVGH